MYTSFLILEVESIKDGISTPSFLEIFNFSISDKSRPNVEYESFTLRKVRFESDGNSI